MEPRQLPLVFADSPKGSGASDEVSELTAREYLLHIAGAQKTKGTIAKARPETSLEEVASVPNLARALLHVAQNKGAAGVDGQSVDEVVARAPGLMPKLRQALLDGQYRPGDVRRVWIPKPGGGQRGLGIPNVIDRWVQQAVHQVLAPVFEPVFHESSHGFRPERGAQTAIAEAKVHLREGRMWVVAIDLSKFFDRVNHQRLLSQMAKKVDDPRILKLVHRMLGAKVVLPDGTRVATDEGTPQGGPLSPLLSNVVLDELDWEMERRGLRFVRYADDFNVYVRSERAGRRVMEGLMRFIEGRLRLKVNADKSCVAVTSDVHFLGFKLSAGADGEVEVGLSERTVERMNTKVRELTPRNWGQSLDDCITQINRYLKGWAGYFARLCTEESVKLLGRFDAHIRRRIRAIIVQQKKRPRYLYRHLLQRGVSTRVARMTAFRSCGIWKKSNLSGVTAAYRNVWFHARMVSLWHLWQDMHPRATASGQAYLPGLEIPA
jgi:group II intron reverse transcriptase/maturase